MRGSGTPGPTAGWERAAIPTSGPAARDAGSASPPTSRAGEPTRQRRPRHARSHAHAGRRPDEGSGGARGAQPELHPVGAENLAEDFLNSNVDGSLVDRAGFLAQMARPCPVADF